MPFINYDLNNILIPKDDSKLNLLSRKFLSLKTNQEETIQIVHIGDSHLQAGFLTEKIKQELFEAFSTDTIASPGFIFPYTIAETNNPYFFKVDYSGNWTYCKNVDQDKTCKLGLSGITIQTKDSNASICVKMKNKRYNNPNKYYFNRIKILHNESDKLTIQVNNKTTERHKNYSIIDLNQITDSICININQKQNSKFDLYGIILENTNSQINYHTIGVNGATAQSYLKCDYFSDHLKLINPDLIILSLGTNEAYDDNFSKIEHEYIFKDLIYQIRNIAPHAAIIVITANDHLKNRQYSNNNIMLVNQNIYKTSRDLNLTFWDFYNIMGGQGSINDWYEKGLTGEDKLHFKRLGYEIQGDLFTKALIDLIKNKTN
jgi:lysophospholipase L1-like esterase